MLKNLSVLTSQVNGRNFEFHCPPDSPLDDAIEANSQHRAFLLGRKQQVNEAAAAPKEQECEYKPVE
jgi:hypothetical protein